MVYLIIVWLSTVLVDTFETISEYDLAPFRIVRTPATPRLTRFISVNG
ncbi:hypothetical protein [Gimesia benthica]|nr:hypothetical protein [Gimesia benthica]